MAWYKTGTVSVQNGQTSITGVSTKFASNTRVGDGFRGPDGEWYEIVNIASETVLGIYPAYQGPTLSESPNYMVAPLQGYNKESADRLREITNSFRDVSDEVASAIASAAAAKVSETNSKASETSANASAVSAGQSATTSSQNAAQTASDRELAMNAAAEADTSRDSASNSAIAAANSETNAATSANNASESETNTVQKATEASQSASSALSSANSATASESAARSSEQAADTSATTATNAATQTTQDRQATQQARDIAEQARDEAVAAAGTVTGGIIDRGGIDLSSGVYPTKPTTSSIWKVTVGGIVGGVDYGVGDALAYSLALDEFYKIDSTDSVTSVNGQGGIVVLTKADIGLSQADNTSDADKPASNAVVTALSGKVDKVTGKSLSDENFTLAEKNKLGSVADGATKNSTDASLLNRANHTGTQLAATISDLASAVRLVTASGIVISNAAILSTDSILVALGKAQGQINSNIELIGTKALSGANSDITSLSGLTTPLSIAQGGNGGDITPYMPLADANVQMNNGMYSTRNAWTGSPFTGTDSRNYGYLQHINWIDNNQQVQRWKSIDTSVKEMTRSKAGGSWGAWAESSSGGGGIAVGTMFPWKFNRATIPGGSLPHDGQIVTNGRTLYPELWALIQPFCVTDAVWLASPYTSRGMFSSGNGSTDFRMPDDNAKHSDGNTIAAMVLRGDGKNSAGTSGLHQVDQMQGFRFGSTESFWLVDNAGYAGGVTTSAEFRGAYQASSGVNPTTNPPLKPFSDKVNGTPRVGSETRSANSTVIWCTVVAKTAVNTGTVDVTVLANTQNLQGTKLDNLDSSLGFTYVYPGGGNAAAPGNIAVNSRYSINNPFPNYPVILRAQILVSGIWEETGWLGTLSSATDNYGVKATQQDTSTIIVQTGVAALGVGGNYDGGSRPKNSGNVAGGIPARVLVWRVKG